MTHFSALILGIVEGFTEFLPISSTAHLILVSKLIGISQDNFVKTFEIAIQSGAILAVIILFWKKFTNIENLKKIVVAFIPTGIIGLALYKIVKTYLLGNIPVVLSALLLGGIILIIFEKKFKEKTGTSVKNIQDMSYKQSAYVGLYQAIAIIPGVSRSGATILGGMLLGISRETIVEFSFLLAVPTMLAATGLDLLKNLHAFSSAQFGTLGLGFIASFVTAIIGIKFLLDYIRKHSFSAFGVYRIIIAILFFFVFL
ncbi:MAG: undecaprenyl-diphosphate phosphatase [Candidatus Pacebacteria bacterium]|nr:undecaprenyl-diphosphate phosphatase [Candidatus Paceibacterota bacterium]